MPIIFPFTQTGAVIATVVFFVCLIFCGLTGIYLDGEKEKKHPIKNFFASFKKNEEKPKKEKKGRLSDEKKNFLIDVFYVISMPALMLIFLFIAIDFFSKDKTGLAVFIVIVAIIETGIFGYGLYLINCEEQNHHFLNKSKLILYGINIAGLIIGFLLALLIGNFVLKIEDSSYMVSIAFICLESAFIISVLLHIITLFVSEFMERRKANKYRKKK